MNGNLLRAEWTKFRSVRRWLVATLAGALLSILFSAFFATASSTNANEGPSYQDEFRFVHQPLTGDGALVARVAGQSGSHEWAKAGLMVKEAAVSGAPYAALFVTPGHGVRLQANFDTDVPGSTSTAPVWLRLTRTGPTITAEESADGRAWTAVGTVTLDALPSTVEVGLFVASPGVTRIDRQFGGTSVYGEPTLGTATFDNVTAPSIDGWRHEDLGQPQLTTGSSEQGGAFTVSGTGDIVRLQMGDNDVVVDSLSGVLMGLVFTIVIAVLFVTAEFRRGMIRTTFVTSPHRGRVFAAKALVIGSVMVVAGMIATAGSYVISRPMLAEHGFTAPAYPELGLFEGPVLRAVVGSALMLGLVAVLSLAVATMVRRGAAAIALLLVLFVLPVILLGGLPLEVAMWVNRVTPIAGLAIMQTRTRFDTAIEPWAGLGVLAAYAIVALLLAMWRVRRRDA